MKSLLILSFLALAYGQLPYTISTAKCPNPDKDSCAEYSTKPEDDIALAFASSDPDATARTPELITNHGYRVQELNVTTKDGYILTMYRIPSSLSGRRAWRSPVLIMHGLLGASHDWVINPADKNLPFMLADQGHDVYLGNNRGTTYSQRHLTLTPNDMKYWDFSWHEMGIYDVPAFMDEITRVSGQRRMYYVGLSEGTTQFFVMSSLNATYSDRIILSSLLAPVAFMSNATNPISYFKHIQPAANTILNTYQGKLDSHLLMGNMYSFAACTNPIVARTYCSNFLFIYGGFNECRMNCSRFPYIMGHNPDDYSLKDIYHYIQLMRSGKFRQFDKRPIADDNIDNLVDTLINQDGISPPEDYPLENIKCKIALFSGSEDMLAAPGDVAIMDAALRKNGVLVQHIKNDYGHLDFYWALTVKEDIFTPVLNLFRRYV